jgi:hypothetical protein
LVVLASVPFALFATEAAATQDNYCTNVTLVGFDHCDGARHTLWMNHAFVSGGTGVCAGQLDENGVFTGSYACASVNAYKCYSPSTLLYPRLHNHDSATHSGFYGDESYGAVGACPP